LFQDNTFIEQSSIDFIIEEDIAQSTDSDDDN